MDALKNNCTELSDGALDEVAGGIRVTSNSQGNSGNHIVNGKAVRTVKSGNDSGKLDSAKKIEKTDSEKLNIKNSIKNAAKLHDKH